MPGKTDFLFLSVSCGVKLQSERLSLTHTHTHAHVFILWQRRTFKPLCRHVHTLRPNPRVPRCALTGGSCQRDLPLLLFIFLPPPSLSPQSLSLHLFISPVPPSHSSASRSFSLVFKGRRDVPTWQSEACQPATCPCFVTQQRCRSRVAVDALCKKTALKKQVYEGYGLVLFKMEAL